jgi:hypothetical protein
MSDPNQPPVPPPPGPPSGLPSGPPAGNGRRKVIGLAGALVALVVLAVVAVLVVVKVVGGSGPASATEDYFEAQSKADVGTLCELSTEDQQKEQFENYDVDSCDAYLDKAQKDLDESFAEFEKATGESFDDLLDDLDLDLEIGDVQEDGDQARVEWKSTTTYTGDNDKAVKELGLEKPRKDDGTVLLCDEDGDWKVKEDHATAEDKC